MTQSYQEVLVSSIGDFGRVQGLIVLACKLPEFIGAWSMIFMSFGGAQPDWWKITHQFNETSICTRLTLNGTWLSWNLVCSRKWIPTVITTSQMIGVLLGAAIMGQFGDWFGRRRCLIGTYTMDLVCIFVQGFAINWYMMTCTVFLVGFSLGGYLVLFNIYMVEFIGTKWRTLAGVLPTWSFGVIFFGVAFKFLPNWRHLCRVAGILGLPSLILMLFMPPSIRWLFTQGRFQEGKSVVRKIAKRNGLVEPDLALMERTIQQMNEENKNEVKYTYLSLFKHRSTRIISLQLGYIWFVQGFGYYGLTLGVGSLSGNMTVNMVLMGLGETISMGLVWLLSKCCGRRRTSIIFVFFTSVTSFGITVAYFSSATKFKVIMNALALTSRFCLSAAWISIIIFTTESYPTVLRSTGYGWASVCARVGGILAPQIKTLRDISVHLPFTLTGVLTAITCILCFFFKDTYSIVLDDHIRLNEFNIRYKKENGITNEAIEEETMLLDEDNCL